MGARMGMIMLPNTAPIMHSEAILTLTQWLSPTYPVGSFAYSHGLEWAVENGQVTCRETMQTWIATVMQHGAGMADARFLVAAYHATDPIPVDAIARAFSASAERYKETVLQGEAFVRATADIWKTELPSLTYPVAVGHSARLHELPLELTLKMYLQAFVSNLAAAGMRLIPLGQTDGHRVIKDLTSLCREIGDVALEGSLDDLSSTAFISDIASMKHETQYARIFRT